VPTIIKGINDDEIGGIVDFGLKTACIRGINFQPAARFGRTFSARENGASNDSNDSNRKQRMTITGILERIESQTNGAIALDDFVPLPCNVDSVAVSYLYKKGDSFTPIARNIHIPSYLPIINNTFYMDAEELLEKEQAKSSLCDCKKYLEQISRFLPAGLSAKTVKMQKEFIDNNTFRISVSMFLDADNFEMHAMQKECVHVITPDFKRIPFSAYNLIHRTKGETDD
ncbi:MAG: hypothetical protein GY757_52520, partial [bacterium]|nr:hypothetical protein [bacterium]